ncbi:hypothetical protein HPNQ4053_0891 [Helicobacter pylori NQ4053]|uniref:Uncharacterized protein n=1 Tax=Helicobacter pylori NQ4053 TaxID=992027 RepID=J0J7Z5_HELPX|nr:hypothetical protein HPNQ4053_0891 [Helicobacter pylori NQ4053]
MKFSLLLTLFFVFARAFLFLHFFNRFKENSHTRSNFKTYKKFQT